MIALWIGLHNLGEGPVIYAAFGVGATALGAFLAVGFIMQNITEGLGIVAPVLRDRFSAFSLIQLGLLGGGPAIEGAWIAGLVFYDVLAIVLLALCAGAIFKIDYEAAEMIRKAAGLCHFTVFAGAIVRELSL